MATVTIPAPVVEAAPTTGAAAAAAVRAGSTVLRALLALTMMLGLWWLAVVWLGETYSFSTRSPLDVARWVSDAPAAVRQQMLTDLGVTLWHAAIGLAAGTVFAVLVAFSFALFRPLEQAFLPVAMVVRSVPLVAMAPLIGLVFGRDILTVAVVGGIVTFFPTLVNVGLGLRSASQQSVDVVRAYGGRRVYTLLRIQFPFALPNLFAALRATAPLAITGAMLAEYFLVGRGLGNGINSARAQFDYDLMWAEAAIATVFSVLTYSLAVGVEGAVLARFAPDRLRAAKAKV